MSVELPNLSMLVTVCSNKAGSMTKLANEIEADRKTLIAIESKKEVDPPLSLYLKLYECSVDYFGARKTRAYMEAP